jgi:hypothetical protein
MALYRCDVLNVGHRIASAGSLEAQDDAEALTKAVLNIRLSAKVWQVTSPLYERSLASMGLGDAVGHL